MAVNFALLFYRLTFIFLIGIVRERPSSRIFVQISRSIGHRTSMDLLHPQSRRKPLKMPQTQLSREKIHFSCLFSCGFEMYVYFHENHFSIDSTMRGIQNQQIQRAIIMTDTTTKPEFGMSRADNRLSPLLLWGIGKQALKPSGKKIDPQKLG